MKKFTFLSILLLFAISGAFAQAPIIYAGKVLVSSPVPVTIDVPVTADNFTDVGAVSLVLDYDYSIMQYDSYTINTTTFPGALIDAPSNGQVRIAWQMGTNSAVTLNDGEVIVTIHFTGYSSGTSLLTWDITTQGFCEISDDNEVAIAGTQFMNGYVSDFSAQVDDYYVTVCEPVTNYGVIEVSASGGSGNFTFKADDGVNLPIINTTGFFTNLVSGTYTISVSDDLYPNVEIIIDPAVTLVVPVVNGYVYNRTTQIYYCYLQDAIAAAQDNDELEFVYPGTHPGFSFNSAISLTFENTSGGEVVIEGSSPALQLASGNLSFDGVSFITTSDDPTIYITGGKLTLRNCVITESPLYIQSGILITGGELDAGTDTDPGKNVFVTDGTGNMAITQSGTAVANAICNYYGSVELFNVAAVISGVVAFDPWNDASLNNCIFSQQGGPLTFAEEKFAPAGTNVHVAVSVKRFNTIDAISLALEFDNTNLTVTGITNLHPALVETPIWLVTGNTFFFGYNSDVTDTSQVNGVTMPVDSVKLFDIVFTTTTGTYPLEWVNDPTNLCEYQNALIQGPYIDEPTQDFYFDGFITDLSAIVTAYTDVICYGADDGTITVAATGGSTNYIYKIDDGSNVSTTTDGNFTGVAPGTYTISVVDANYPQVEYVLPNTVTIAEPPTPLVASAFESHKVRCKGESNGQAIINASGGWGGIMYSIDGVNYQVNNYFDALSVGVYTLYARDISGCVVTDTVQITEPAIALTGSGVESKVVTCKGGNDGEVTLTGYDGWGGYTYSKDNLNFYLSPVLTGFTAGNYTLWIKDDGGCKVSVNVTVTEPAVALSATAAKTKKVSCYGYSDGEITVYPVGGWGSYEFSIDGGLTYNTYVDDKITGLVAGTYTVHVRDLHGCVVSTGPVVVDEPQMLTAVISGDTAVCYGQIANVKISFYGGNPPYQFSYSDGIYSYTGNTSASTFLFGMVYTSDKTWTITTLTDAKGCPSDLSASGSATITVNPLPVVTSVDMITSVDQTTWEPIGGDLTNGYVMCVDPVIQYHYLGVDDMTLANVPLETVSFVQNAFYLDVASVPSGFYTYWAAKGVVSGATGWQALMWDIINGISPMFYISYDGTDYALIDGLQFQTGGGTPMLRISGDYPEGTYVFNGTVLDENGCTSLPFDVTLTLNSSPVVTDVSLLQSIDQTTWDPVAGDLAAGFEMCVDETIPYHYLDIDVLTYGLNALETATFDQNAFYLDVASVPTDFYTYWAAKGVVSGATGWQGIMWDVINGTAPMLYIAFDGTDYTLVDGLQHQAFATTDDLRISGDYPAGTYIFTGTVMDENGCTSSPFSIEMTLTTMPQPDAGLADVSCNSATYQLNAAQSVYDGIWTQTAGPGTALFSNDISPVSDVTVDVAGDYTLTWTETNSICSKSDDVVITFLKGTLADAYTVGAIANIDAVSGAPVVTNFSYNLPTPDVTADNHIIMDGMLSVVGGSFPAGAEVVEVRRVAQITTTWFTVVDGDLSGKDFVLLSELLGFQNPLYNNELNDYNWVITVAGIDGVTTLELDFALITYVDAPQGLTTDCYAVLDNTTYEVFYREAVVTAQDAEVCFDPPGTHALDFDVAIAYPVINNVDINDEVMLDAKLKITAGGPFNTGATLMWGYNAPATNPSAVNIDGVTELYLSDIVGGSPMPMANHSGTDVWSIKITGADAGVYEITTEALALITVVEPTTNPLQIPGTPANPLNIYPAPDPGHYATYEYVYADDQLTLTVYPLPEITLVDPDPKVCHGATSVDFEYTATANNPDEYSITWDQAALQNGFMDVTGATLPSTPIVVTMSGIAVQGVYTGELVVINSVTGCVSEVYPITVSVPAPFSVIPDPVPVTCNGHNDGEAGVIVTGGWDTSYDYLWDDPATQTTNPATGLYAGTYNVVITDAQGCTTTATVEVTEPDVLAGTVVSTDITCHGADDGTIEVINSTGGYGNYEYRLDNGTWQTSSLFTDLAPGIYNVQMRDADEIHCEMDLGDVTLVEPPAYSISGYYTYLNLFNTPLNNITVHLVQSGDTLYTTTTDASGYYEFPNVCNGTYEVISATIKPVGGINATDAVQVNIWGTSGPNYPAIEKVQFKAGDVVFSNTFTAGDAGRILQYFVTSGNPPFSGVEPWSFWKTNDFISLNNFTDGAYPDVTMGPASMTQNFYGLVTGDFNRSFVPGNAKSGGSVVLTNNSSVVADGLNEFELPITTETAMDVTAMSLIMNYPADKVEVLGVTLGANPDNNVMFSAQNGELRIGWSSIVPANFGAGDVVLTLKVRALSALTAGESAAFTLTADQLNEFAGSDYLVMPYTLLNIPAVESTVSVQDLPAGDLTSFMNYPNPFSGSTNFVYELTSDATVTLELFDMTGRKVDVLVNSDQSAGRFEIPYNSNTIGAGLYHARLTVVTNEGASVRSIKIVNRK